MSTVISVNVGSAEPNPFKQADSTGFHKKPVDGPVEVRAPRASRGVSGLVGDVIGDKQGHGGDAQAVYALPREDLDHWAAFLERDLPSGAFGENLTTLGVDVNNAVLGERWRVGSTVELVVTVPRVPCSTFAGVIGKRGWIKGFTRGARPGTYLSVAVPGQVRGGDAVEVLHRPDHGVTVEQCFRAMTTDRSLLPSLAAAGDDLVDDLAARVDYLSGSRLWRDQTKATLVAYRSIGRRSS